MPTRKRPIAAVQGNSTQVDRRDAEAKDQHGTTLLHRVRNMWQFANLCQWVYIFGKAAKIDDAIDIDEIEAACLKPDSVLLADLALAILKLISSHRGLTHDILDDQLRKQYLAKAPEKNPFGDLDTPHRFTDFEVVDKIKVLQQLTQWTMLYSERIRDKMEEQKDTEQTNWRIEPYGWDREDRTYFVLDDNRIYRLTEPPPVEARPKTKKNKSARNGRRSSQRFGAASHGHDMAHEEQSNGTEATDNGLGGQIWECLAITLQDVRDFLSGLDKTRDQNEKVLRRQLETHLVPILEKQEEAQKRKELQKQRELMSLEKMANAKRSSRIAGRAEKQKQEEKAKEDEQMRKDADDAKRREEQQRLLMEKERDFRMFSRQRRLQEREARRRQHQEELAQLSEDSRRASSGAGRVSERRLQAELDKNRQALLDLEQEEEDWVFDCRCGLYGKVDDGSHSVACERCNVWQHSQCLGIDQQEADGPNFSFICGPCQRRDEAAKSSPRAIIKLKLHSKVCTDMYTQPSPVSSGSLAGQFQRQMPDSGSEVDRTITVATLETHGAGSGEQQTPDADAVLSQGTATSRPVELDVISNAHLGPRSETVDYKTETSKERTGPELQDSRCNSSTSPRELVSLQDVPEKREGPLSCLEGGSRPNGQGSSATAKARMA
ncbi:hypothetical protein CDD81_3661 [Ophiocordyceps australis]|uniref:Zinc finger PHD-type domain-containing protein n=1 Tax=Ophiocordyceps australis TaxID=1399860 RepID=A0A2C5XPH9_9HYPO|nr:hypothetical protein CDD81_3661 [Ophiocordyceps australis]